MTRSGVSGSSRTRNPSACATALAIAAPVGPWAASPAPTLGRSGRSISSTPTFGGRPARPIRALRRRLDHRPGALILQMSQTKLDWVEPSSICKLVHEGFDRKYVCVGTERAQRRGAHRHLAHVVVDDTLARKIVERYCIAVRGARRERHIDRRGPLERPRQMPGRDKGGVIRAAGPAA